MKLTCLQENLAKALNTVTRAVPAKGPLPILSNVLLSAENGRLKLSATNLETTIITNTGASISKDGAITVPARLLKDFVTNLPSGNIDVSVSSDVMHVTSNKTKSRFNGISANDYPELPEIDKKTKFMEIDPKEFNNAVSVVAFASGTDESRPIFTGILLTQKGSKLTIVSTDGFRLSEKTISVDGEEKESTAVIPSRTLLEVAKIFSSSSDPIKFALNENENLAIFKSDETVVLTRLLDGSYPDYKRIVPKEFSINVNFLAQEFLEAVKLTNIFSKEGNNAMKLVFDPEGSIKIASLSGESGEHESTIGAEVEGDLVEVAFNAKYLLDFLSNVKAEKINFSTNGSTTACMLKTKDHENFLHIIMPIQV